MIGTFSEYFMSLICEQVFHFKWWDYSEYLLNVNGRICLYFAALWGILGIGLIRYINPWINNVLEMSFNSPVKIFILIITVFLIIDIFISIIALRLFFKKVALDYKIDKTVQISDTEASLLNYFNEDVMLKTYPNLQIAGTNMNNTYVDSLYKNIQTYYIKLKKM